jgi:hypothetical protein
MTGVTGGTTPPAKGKVRHRADDACIMMIRFDISYDVHIVAHFRSGECNSKIYALQMVDCHYIVTDTVLY